MNCPFCGKEKCEHGVQVVSIAQAQERVKARILKQRAIYEKLFIKGPGIPGIKKK